MSQFTNCVQEDFQINHNEKILSLFHNPSFILLLLVCLPSAVLALVKFQKSRRKSSNKIPSVSFLGTMFHIMRNKNDIPKVLEAYAQKYETLFKINMLGQSVVMINSPEMLHKMLSSTNPGHLNKPKSIYGKLFLGVSANGILSSEVEKWSPHRKLMNKAFNYESLKSYVAVFNKHANCMISDLSLNVKNGYEGGSLGAVLHISCLDVITEIVLGITLDAALTPADKTSFYKSIKRLQEIITYRFFNPWFLSEFIWRFHPYKKEMESCVESMEHVLYKLMKKRMDEISNRNVLNSESPSYQKAVLDKLLKENWFQEELLAEISDLLIGGHETVSTALNILLFILATEKDHQVACQEEVDRMCDDLEISGKSISIESLNQLKYLDRCIKETLRMFPIAAITWRQLDAPLQLDDDIVLDPGTKVLFPAWSLQRNPKYFSNPGKFDPSRFLPENIRARTAHTYIPFSEGVRNCIGWKMAMLEMTCMAAAVLRHFDISTTEKLSDVNIKFSFTIWPEKDLKITLQKRI